MRRSVAVLVAAVPVIAVSLGVSGLAQAPKAAPKPAPKAAPQPAPEQAVTPPEARYWVGATTGAGVLAMGGLANGGRPVHELL